MNDRQIYELVHQQPRIKASEIANILGVELVVVSNALRSLVDVGDLVKSKEYDDVTGRQSQVYELSDEFKKSREGKALAAAPAPPPPAPLPPELVAELSKAGQAAIANPEALGGTKVERAMECIRSTGGATDDKLRAVMGIGPKIPVASYLNGPRHRGEIHREGELWVLTASVKPTTNLEVVGNVIIATRDQTPVPAEVKAAVTEMATAAATELRKPDPAPSARIVAPDERPYRCAIWIDGKVEIHKGYDTVILTQAELAEIVAFAADRRAA